MEFIMQPGKLYLIPAHTPSVYSCPDKMYLHFFHFTATLLGVMNIFDVFECDYEITPEEPNAIQYMWDKFHKARQSDNPGGLIQADGLIREFLAMFMATAHEEKQTSRIQQILRFSEVLAYIKNNLERQISLDELAEIMRLQPRYFANLFTRHIGVSPVRYIRQLRMERAQQMLWESKLTVQKIAHAIGFEDVFYFSRMFKKSNGMSPSEFRRRVYRNIP